MTIVSGAVAGDDLERVASAASEAVGYPVAIALPALGQPVVWPPGAIPSEELTGVAQYAAAVVGDSAADAPSWLAQAVPIRIGAQVVGVVVAIRGPGAQPPPHEPAQQPQRGADHRPWLEATAAAAAVATLMREAHEVQAADSRRGLLEALSAGPPRDVQGLVAHARSLGVDLSTGGIAVCARWRPGATRGSPLELSDAAGALVASFDGERIIGIVPLAGPTSGERDAAGLTGELAARGMEVGVSAPRRHPSALHEALTEAMLLAELACSQEAGVSGQEETYRLLIGVLLRDPEELAALRARTIASLIEYDAEHDTELLITLHTFLAHHGSTTETAESMQLHRHTVGYRLSRVQEVSGLSPYESDGRERLSLGLKAEQILAAHERLSKPG